MRITALFLVLAFRLFASVQMTVPSAPAHPVTDTYPGGLKVTDNYRWLEDSASPATKAWLAEENAYSNQVLNALPQRDKVLSLVKQQYATQDASYVSLQVRNGRLFALRSDANEPATKLVAFRNPTDKASERTILDLGKVQHGKIYQADWYSVSPDGKSVGIALSEGGSEDGALYLFSTGTGKPIDVVLPHVQFATAGGSMAWKADSSGFFYTRYPRGTERPSTDLNFFQQLYFHRLGTPAAADTYVLGRELPRIAEIALTASPDGSQFLVSVENGDGGEYAFYTITPDNVVHTICAFADKITSATFGADNSLWLLTRKLSARGALLHLPSSSVSLSFAKLVVPPSDASLESNEPSSHLVNEFVSSRYLYLKVINGGPEQIRVYTLEGERLSDVAGPAVASIGTLVPLGNSGLLFSAVTYTTPRQWYSVLGTAPPHPLPFRNDSTISLADVEVERVFAPSKDRTPIPVTLLHRKGLERDGTNPTILYGYGGYGISMTPQFIPDLRAFYDAGGIFAIANVRGGGEYGEDWHTAGKLLNKQNVFDDFAASAQYLIDEHYTSSSHLAGAGCQQRWPAHGGHDHAASRTVQGGPILCGLL